MLRRTLRKRPAEDAGQRPVKALRLTGGKVSAFFDAVRRHAAAGAARERAQGALAMASAHGLPAEKTVAQ